MNATSDTSSNVVSSGTTTSHERSLRSGHKSGSFQCNVISKNKRTSAREEASLNGTGDDTVGSEGHTLKRPISTDEQHHKRRLVALSDQEACPDADTRAGYSGERKRNEGNQATEESRRMAMEAEDEDGYLLLNVSLPRDVNMGNMLNNPDADSLLLATLTSATSINLATTPAVTEAGTVTQGRQSRAAMRSEENEDISDEEPEFDACGSDLPSGTGNNALVNACSSRSATDNSLCLSEMQLMMKYVLLEELLLANLLWERSENTPPPLKGSCADDFTTDDFYNTSHFIFFNSVEQHRTLSGFKELSTSDQVALMSTTIYLVNRCRFAIKHNMKTGKTYLGYPSAPEMSAEIAKTRMKRGYKHSQMQRFRNIFTDEYRNNDSILVILCALALFNPEAPGVINLALVEYKRRTYSDLLQHYLQSTFGEKESKCAFRFLTTWLSCVCMIPEDNDWGTITCELDPSTCELANVHVTIDHDVH